MATAVMENDRQTAPPPYDGFERFLVDGAWRLGGSGRTADDRDPYTDEVLVRVSLANEEDIDDAYQAAASAQRAWSERRPRGRICMITNRIIADAKVHDEFVDRFVARVRKPKVGNPAVDDTVIGPVINQSRLRRLRENIEKARADGARRIEGGEPPGLVLPPQVFVDVTNEMTIAREEQFGPVASIIKVRDEVEALETANATSYGPSGSVVTRDLERGLRFALRVRAGMTHVNDSPVNDPATCPFGGEKNSGIGRYNGEWAIEEFTTPHWISVRHEPATYPF